MRTLDTYTPISPPPIGLSVAGKDELRLQRLDRCKTLLNSKIRAMRRKADALETQRRYAREVIELREEVVDLHRLLSDAEHNMIRRWGVEKTIGLTWKAVACLGLMLLVSVFAAGRLAERTWSATAQVRHLSPTVLNSPDWLEGQRRRITHPDAVEQAAAQLSRVLTPGEVTTLLATGLGVSSPAPNIVQLELQGSDAGKLTRVLDAAVLVYTDRARPADPVVGVEAAERTHIIQKASLSPVPVGDNRGELSLMFFAVSIVVTAGVTVLFAAALIRTRPRESASVDCTRLLDDRAWAECKAMLETPIST